MSNRTAVKCFFQKNKIEEFMIKNLSKEIIRVSDALKHLKNFHKTETIMNNNLINALLHFIFKKTQPQTKLKCYSSFLVQ